MKLSKHMYIPEHIEMGWVKAEGHSAYIINHQTFERLSAGTRRGQGRNGLLAIYCCLGVVNQRMTSFAAKFDTYIEGIHG